MDTGRVGVGTGNICHHPDGTHSRGSHPDIPHAVGLDAGMEGAGRKEQVDYIRNNSYCSESGVPFLLQ